MSQPRMDVCVTVGSGKQLKLSHVANRSRLSSCLVGSITLTSRHVLQPSGNVAGVFLETAWFAPPGCRHLCPDLDTQEPLDCAQDQEFVRPGFELGYVDDQGKYYVHNHLVFNILVGGGHILA
jgi:hypothetical protein